MLEGSATSPAHAAGNGRAAAKERPALWHKSAPSAVRKAAHIAEGGPSFEAWARHLTKRSRPRDIQSLLPGKRSALTWALPHSLSEGETGELIDRVAAFRRGRSQPGRPIGLTLALWMDKDVATSPDALLAYALECLSWAHALPQLAAQVGSQAWWALVERLMQAAGDAGSLSADKVLLRQLLSAELPLALAYLLPELIPCRGLAPPALSVLDDGLQTLLDDHGVLHARHLDVLRPLLASWTRSATLGRAWRKCRWDVAAHKRFAGFVREALRLSRRDGSQVFSTDDAADTALFHAAVEAARSKSTRRVATVVLSDGKKLFGPLGQGRKLPDASRHSETAMLAILRDTWSRNATTLTVAYDRPTAQIELSCGRDRLLSGEWKFQVEIDGHLIHPLGDWEQVCWSRDKHVSYLELEIDLAEGVRLQRHILLAHKDQFVFLADAVLADRAGRIGYRSNLPVRQEISIQPASETRELHLHGDKSRGPLMGLALPEWRTDPRVGTLEPSDAGLELRQAVRAQRLFAPLWMDLNPKRAKAACTWRQLTVAQDRVNQSPDIAVGYRLQVGPREWLIYRSLAPVGNRTVLGKNLSTEFFVGRFLADGDTFMLLEIE